MRMLLGYLRPYAARMAGGLGVKLFGSVMDLLLPWILAYMIDSVVPMEDVGAIAFWGVMMLVCSIIAVLGNIIANRMAARVSRDVTRSLRHDLYSRVLHLSSAQVDEAGVPRLITCLSSDTYNVHRMVSSMQRLGVRAPILLLGGIAVTLALEPVLALTLLAVLPFIVVVVVLVSRKGIPLYSKLQQAVDGMTRVIRENASGIRIIKALSKENDEQARFAAANGEVTGRERKAGVTMAASSPIMNLLLNLGLTLVVLVGAYRVNGGFTQPGKILAFLSYFAIILNAMLAITRMFVMLSQGTASAGRIAAVMDLPADLALMPPDHVDTEAHILFEHVGFAYAKQRQDAAAGEAAPDRALHDVSFALKRGQTLGLIGATGSGKSTLVQLLMRLYDPDEGHIRIGGEDIRGIPPEKLHAMFGVVFQDDALFADSVSENVDFGRELDEADLRAAVYMAQAREFVEDTEAGFEHQLAQRGANLSGGQRQRLLIARALAAKPDILILDDASSALDYRTDARLRGAIRENLAGATTVIVAQRVSAIRHADLILLLDEGRVAGRGTHAQLMESSEVYREIVESQMGGVADAG